MDRQAWLAERRAAVMADYDAEAPTYDMNLYPAGTQETWVARLLAAQCWTRRAERAGTSR